MINWFNVALAVFAIVQFTGMGVSFASPETSARVERLDRAFREVSVTTFEAVALGMAEGMWEKYRIRGKGISLDDNATLHVKYDRCNNQTIAGLRTESDNPVVSTFPCEGAKWALVDAKYSLVNFKLPTIEVREKSGPQNRGPFSASWFAIEFVYIGENGFAVPDASIECSGRQACETMAEDLRALVKSVQTLHDAVTRISENYRGIVFQRQFSSQGETRVLVAKADLIDTNLAARLRTRQQFCVRKQDQDCDRDKLWRERIALADITKLSSGVEIDDVRFVSDDKTIGVVTVKCAEGGCWAHADRRQRWQGYRGPQQRGDPLQDRRWLPTDEERFGAVDRPRNGQGGPGAKGRSSDRARSATRVLRSLKQEAKVQAGVGRHGRGSLLRRRSEA